jgi:hypothetical protein
MMTALRITVEHPALLSREMATAVLLTETVAVHPHPHPHQHFSSKACAEKVKWNLNCESIKTHTLSESFFYQEAFSFRPNTGAFNENHKLFHDC